jgi:hypothetical protein
MLCQSPSSCQECILVMPAYALPVGAGRRIPQQPRVLLSVERIPCGGLNDASQDIRRYGASSAGHDELLDGPPRQRPQRDTTNLTVTPDQAPESLEQLGPRRQNQEQRPFGPVADQPLDEVKHRLASPVEVLEHDDGWPYHCKQLQIGRTRLRLVLIRSLANTVRPPCPLAP